jgi:hypothetical protein
MHSRCTLSTNPVHGLYSVPSPRIRDEDHSWPLFSSFTTNTWWGSFVAFIQFLHHENVVAFIRFLHHEYVMSIIRGLYSVPSPRIRDEDHSWPLFSSFTTNTWWESSSFHEINKIRIPCCLPSTINLNRVTKPVFSTFMMGNKDGIFQ